MKICKKTKPLTSYINPYLVCIYKTCYLKAKDFDLLSHFISFMYQLKILPIAFNTNTLIARQYAGAVESMGSGEPAPQSMEERATAPRWPPR